jgi:hypothetical protein
MELLEYLEGLCTGYAITAGSMLLFMGLMIDLIYGDKVVVFRHLNVQ